MLVHKRSLFASSPPRLSRQGRQVLLEALHKAGEVVGRDVEVVQPLVLVVDEERHQVDRTRVDGIRSCHDGTAACEVLLERVGVETALCRLVARAPLVAAQLVGDAGLGARQRIEDHVARQGRDLPRVEFGRGAADRGSEGVRAEGQSADILLVPVPLRLRPTTASITAASMREEGAVGESGRLARASACRTHAAAASWPPTAGRRPSRRRARRTAGHFLASGATWRCESRC
mmetsp:Transcript_24449/g.78922  ORF Transcript_24449/g.78922 Transcript_24449/m.78922 type:complete len:232 (-) Transcript_24449:468-1163(-)